MNQDRLYVLITTLPDRAAAEALAAELVAGGWAACAQVGAELASFYRWEGKIQREGEVQLVLKVPAASVAACARELKHRHPYQVPQILGWAADVCDPDYLAWAQGGEP